VTVHRLATGWSRALVAAVCCALVLQAFLSAFGTALAFGQASGGETFAICHGAPDTAPATGDDNRKHVCATCAVATGGGLPSDPIAVTLAPLAGFGVSRLGDTILIVALSPVRAGLSRAPPGRA
jgi:hypothetical protein